MSKHSPLINEQDLEEFDQKINEQLDKGGWFFLVLLAAFLFVVIYFATQYFKLPNDAVFNSLNEQVSHLEERVDQLESLTKEQQRLIESFETKRRE